MPTEEAVSKATYTTVPPEIDASTRPQNGGVVCSAPESPQHWSFPKAVGRQLLAWTLAVLTAVFLILTAIYGSQTTAVSHVRFLYNSSSHAIFVLSMLSGLTGLFLGTTVTSAFEKVQWVLVSRKDGLQLSKYLSLQAGTGVMGLLTLTMGVGHSILSSTRLWSATRLTSIILIPAIGILIMSKSCFLSMIVQFIEVSLEGNRTKFIVLGAIQDHPHYNYFTFMSFFCVLFPCGILGIVACSRSSHQK